MHFDARLKRKQPTASTPIHDVGHSLEVERLGRNDTIPNELDVAFLADNRPLYPRMQNNPFR